MAWAGRAHGRPRRGAGAARILGVVAVVAFLAAGAAGGEEDKPRVPLGRNLLENFIVVPEYKTLFCYIEKVGCTSFSILFDAARRAQGASSPNDWRRIFNQSSPRRFGLQRADLEEMVADPSWFKAVFVRDPLERFLSAFLSKCTGGHDRNGAKVCTKGFGTANLTFVEAVLMAGNATNGTLGDKHFVPQVHFCGGLNSLTLPHYNMVELFRPETVRERVLDMLQRAGIPLEPIQHALDRAFPAPKKRNVEKRHITNSKDMMAHFYSEPWMVKTVAQYSWADYVLLTSLQLDATSTGKFIDPDPDDGGEGDKW